MARIRRPIIKHDVSNQGGGEFHRASTIRPELTLSEPETTSAGFKEAFATLDQLEALLAKVAPFIERFDQREARELLCSNVARVRLEPDVARQNTLLAEGIVPV